MKKQITRPVEPLSEAVFFILLSIQNSPKHGYAIMKEVEQLSDQRIRLSTGTLYGAIKRLLENIGSNRLSRKKHKNLAPIVRASFMD